MYEETIGGYFYTLCT